MLSLRIDNMDNSPLVSVIVPCYNQAKYLPDALSSIFEQTYNNWECIIVNDGSSDTTEKVALEWCRKDIRFKYLKKENGGLSSARNAGLVVARGDYYQFLDADDIIEKNKLLLQTTFLENNQFYKICYCDYLPTKNLFHYNEVKSRYLSPAFKTSNYIKEIILNWEISLSIPCHCFLIKKDIIKKFNLAFDENLKNHEDWDFWINLFLVCTSVYYIDSKLAIYRIRANAMSSDRKEMRAGFCSALLKQKVAHKNNIELYTLFNQKYNLVRYGHKTNYLIIAMVIGFLKRRTRKLRKITRRLTF